QVAPVSGTVTMNGKPLVKAQVTFQPIGGNNQDPGPGSCGITDAQGRFTLLLLDKEKPGAVVGKHRVMISNFRNDPGKDESVVSPETIPARYNTESRLTFDVPAGGTTAADFPLQMP